jgi:DNA-binding NarL/FixJ family response regulator
MRAGEPADHIAAHLTELSEGCQARMLAAKTSHATHLAAHHAPGLLKTSTGFQETGALLYASEAAADAAEVLIEAGRSDSARRGAARSRELHIAAQATPRPVIRGLDADAIELTPRETEVVELARTGLSNGEIAERLVLSKRTIESDMHHAMQKLGSRDRRDL